MSLANPICVPVWAAASSANILKVVQGGSTTIASENYSTSSTSMGYHSKGVILWNGNIIFPAGHPDSTSLGFMSYRPSLGKFMWVSGRYNSAGRFYPLGDYLAYINSTCSCQQTSPAHQSDLGYNTNIGSAYDAAHIGNTVFITGSYTASFAYPFTSTPSVNTGLALDRICAHKGSMYGVQTGSTTYLYKFSGGSWGLVGSFSPSAGTILSAYATQASFFSVGGKLWLILTYSATGQLHRLYEINPSTGGGTEQDSLLHANMKGTPSANQRIFEVEDDTGSSRLVYIFSTNYLGGWECFEFDGSNAMSSIASGSDRFSCFGGVIWAPDAKMVHVESLADSNPSSYLTIGHRTYDISNNGTVDIAKLRYNDLSNLTQTPPYPECTEKSGVGSEGKTGLSSKPSGYSSLSDLSDDFGDASIDPELWEIVSPSINWNAGASYKDRGGCTSNSRHSYSIVESGGDIRFGGTSPTPTGVQHVGVGIRGRWQITGAFGAKAKLVGLANMNYSASTPYYYRVGILVKCGTNKGYGMVVQKTAAGTANVVGFSMTPNSQILESSVSSATVGDNDELHIYRNSSHEWSLAICQDDLDIEWLTPASMPDYDGPVEIWLFAITHATGGANWAVSTPGPGFSNLTVYGAGSLGLFDGGELHDFMWDHITDLGVGQNKAVQIVADV